MSYVKALTHPLCVSSVSACACLYRLTDRDWLECLVYGVPPFGQSALPAVAYRCYEPPLRVCLASVGTCAAFYRHLERRVGRDVRKLIAEFLVGRPGGDGFDAPRAGALV